LGAESEEQYTREMQNMIDHPAGYIPWAYVGRTMKPYAEYLADIHAEESRAVNGLIDYIHHAPAPEKKARYIIQLSSNGYYVESLRTNSRMIRITPNKESAHTFHATQTEIDKLLSKIPASMGAQALKA
jgi:hypothetical protein